MIIEMSLDAICWSESGGTMTNSSKQTQINLKALFHVEFFDVLCFALFKSVGECRAINCKRAEQFEEFLH
jgi:hypothetical protein